MGHRLLPGCGCHAQTAGGQGIPSAVGHGRSGVAFVIYWDQSWGGEGHAIS